MENVVLHLGVIIPTTISVLVNWSVGRSGFELHSAFSKVDLKARTTSDCFTVLSKATFHPVSGFSQKRFQECTNLLRFQFR